MTDSGGGPIGGTGRMDAATCLEFADIRRGLRKKTIAVPRPFPAPVRTSANCRRGD
jgi:hypothetical protein